MFLDKEIFKSEFIKKLNTTFGKGVAEATENELYHILGGMIKDEISENWIKTNTQYKKEKMKQTYYFSMEFLLGRMMGVNLMNLQIYQFCKEGLLELGIKIKDLEEAEPDAGLGNGGLGRLAACFLDSLASLGLPGHGCGIRYKYGLFEQRIVDGYQIELPDNWLNEGNVWEIRRLDKAVEVKFYGHVIASREENRLAFKHYDYETVLAVPYDMPMIGYDNNIVNTLRLWSSEMANDEFQNQLITDFNQRKIIECKRSVEAISEFLYPDDSQVEGKKLRLKQQYFFVSAGIQSILRNFRQAGGELRDIPNRIAVHINDTHPVLVIPELMRILIDEEKISWDEAWRITTQTISYTNHTTLSEALETWPIDMVKILLPRIYMIVEEIDKRFSQLIGIKYLGNQKLVKKVAIINEGKIHMANLAVAASYSVNGVALLHTEILEKKLMKELYRIFPEKFNNKTNGISHRRWLINANPKLADIISESIGTRWIKEPGMISELTPFSKDAAFKEQIQKIKYDNKLNLAKLIKEQSGIIVDADSIFDVQVKRLHAYKRQVLNVLHIINLYNRVKENPNLDIPPRTFIFGAKAAPSYCFAKNVIKLINEVGKIVNNDPAVNQKMKVIFLENYRVSLAEKIIPAADLSEQISTAGKEASGTGNMKFMMNGALTIGTLDGANIEIKEAVGDENIFIFGLKPNEVHDYYQNGGYNSFEMYNTYPDIHKIVDQLISGKMMQSYEATRDVYNALLVDNDQYFVLKDFHSYVDAQNRAAEVYRNKDEWARKAIINIANSGKFSGDRTINEYADEIWKIKPVSF